jgi:hypothetical protein
MKPLPLSQLQADLTRLEDDDLTVAELFEIHARSTASSKARLRGMRGLKRKALVEELARSDAEIQRLRRIWACRTFHCDSRMQLVIRGNA